MKSSIKVSKENNKESENAKPNPITEKIKSDYFLQKLYDIMPKKKKLEIVKYNKRIQNRLNLGVKDYKEYCEIEVDIIPNKDNENIKSNPSIGNIKSNYILSKIYDNTSRKKELEILKCNKKIKIIINHFNIIYIS